MMDEDEESERMLRQIQAKFRSSLLKQNPQWAAIVGGPVSANQGIPVAEIAKEDFKTPSIESKILSLPSSSTSSSSSLSLAPSGHLSSSSLSPITTSISASSHIIGNDTAAKTIANWLRNAGTRTEAGLYVFGPTGVGKWSTVQYHAVQNGFQLVHFDILNYCASEMDFATNIVGILLSRKRHVVVCHDIEAWEGEEDRRSAKEEDDENDRQRPTNRHPVAYLASLLEKLLKDKKQKRAAHRLNPLIFLSNEKPRRLAKLYPFCKVVKFYPLSENQIKYALSKDLFVQRHISPNIYSDSRLSGLLAVIAKHGKGDFRFAKNLLLFESRFIGSSFSSSNNVVPSPGKDLESASDCNVFQHTEHILTSMYNSQTIDRLLQSDHNCYQLLIHENFCKKMPSVAAMLNVSEMLSLGDVIQYASFQEEGLSELQAFLFALLFQRASGGIATVPASSAQAKETKKNHHPTDSIQFPDLSLRKLKDVEERIPWEQRAGIFIHAPSLKQEPAYYPLETKQPRQQQPQQPEQPQQQPQTNRKQRLLFPVNCNRVPCLSQAQEDKALRSIYAFECLGNDIRLYSKQQWCWKLFFQKYNYVPRLAANALV
jgi:hypothetical protein